MTQEQLVRRNEAIRLAWDDPLRRGSMVKLAIMALTTFMAFAIAHAEEGWRQKGDVQINTATSTPYAWILGKDMKWHEATCGQVLATTNAWIVGADMIWREATCDEIKAYGGSLGR